MFHCNICNYITDRKYNLQRHFSNKHHGKIDNSEFIKNGENVVPVEENVVHKKQNVVQPCFLCEKCNRKYKTMKYLLKHTEKCTGLDNLTCPKCMKSFSNRSNKCNHIKKNNCKSRSIIYARTPNVQNVTNNNITNNITNNIQNNNNIYINNFGNERLDHITNEDIKRILTSGINTLPMYIEMKHFDKNFPENNNIVYTNENKCKVRENDKWLEKDLKLLSNKLIQDSTEVLLFHFDENLNEITEAIDDIDIIDRVKDKLIVVYNKSDSKKYSQIMLKIKELIKNFK